MQHSNGSPTNLQELKEALHGNNKEALEKEFADVIAWLASLANITDVDLNGQH